MPEVRPCTCTASKPPVRWRTAPTRLHSPPSPSKPPVRWRTIAPAGWAILTSFQLVHELGSDFDLTTAEGGQRF